MEKKHDEAAEIALNSPAECLMIPANISSEVVGKEYYKRSIGFEEAIEKKFSTIFPRKARCRTKGYF
jgi:hypothetical protein